MSNRSLIFGILTFLSLSLNGAPRPNVILIMADDMGFGDPSYNSRRVVYASDGSAHPDQSWISTPVMDSMAAQGLRFDRFYSASTVCSPTRASCLTGRHPDRVGVTNANAGRLGFDETPLSEVLSAVGYRTGHFGKWHLGTLTTLRNDANRGGTGSGNIYSGPWHHDYNECFVTESKVPTYDPYTKTSHGTPRSIAFDDGNFYGTHFWKIPESLAPFDETGGEGAVVEPMVMNALFETDVDGNASPLNADASRLITNEAIKFIRSSVSENKPFFLVLWYHTPHKPLVDPDGISGTDSSDACKDAIEDMDTAIGTLRSELETLGVKGNTMLWLTSDNGPENGVNSPNETSTSRSIRSGRFRDRKRSFYDGGLRVPGILEWPDVVTAPASTDVPVVTSDYYTTIIDYLELSVPGQLPLDGVSLRPIIEGSSTTRSKPIGFRWQNSKAWMTTQYKLVKDGGSAEWELYDMLSPAVGEELEQTPLATASNLTSQIPAVQDTYNALMVEYLAWESSVSSDVSYIHSSQPTVSLSTASNAVIGSFNVAVTFSQSVSELNVNEFAVTNGAATSLSGSGTNWTVVIAPAVNGIVTIHLPEGSAINAEGAINAPSNEVTVIYADLSSPTVVLSSPASSVSADFVVNITFSEAVTGLEIADFSVTNGNLSDLAGAGDAYTVTVLPNSFGTISLSLPEGVVIDGNAPSNTLNIDFAPIVGQAGTGVGQILQSSVSLSVSQTVDLDGNVPADQDNNVSKFTAGTENDAVLNPYTTAFYVRSSGTSERSVRAFAKVDLSEFDESASIDSAILTFNGHSLNNQNTNEIEVIALAADWSESIAPLPTFNHPTVGAAINGGSIITSLDAMHTKDYSFDITSIVQNWLDGTWPNYGLMIRLVDSTTNNGVGIQPSVEGTFNVEVVNVPLEFISHEVIANASEMAIEWNSIPGATYLIEVSDTLQNDWETLIYVLGASASTTTRYSDQCAFAERDKRFYRVVFLSK